MRVIDEKGRSQGKERAEASSAPSFEAVYEGYKHRVFRWAMRYGAGRAGWAEDLTHDVFVKTLERLSSLRDGDDLGPWLYRVTANLAVSRIRHEQSIFAKVARLYIAGREETAEAADRLFEDGEATSAAMRAIAELPAQERVVLVMTLLDGKSQREVAAALELSEGYVSKLMSRGKERLRKIGWGVDDGE